MPDLAGNAETQNCKAMSGRILALSCRDLNVSAGGSRRVRALLRAIGPQALLCQPLRALDGVETVPFTHTWGRWGINWGIFNFFRPVNRRHVARLIREHNISLAVLTSIWDLQAVKSFPGLQLVLDAQNVEWTAIAERFGARHPFTRMVRAWEAKVASRMAHIFTCSGVDRQAFIAEYAVAPDVVTVVPNGVDAGTAMQVAPAIEDDHDAILRRLSGKTVLFFMGQLHYQPNTEAVRWMAQTLFPALEQRAPGRFMILVCGGGEIPSGSESPGLVFAGHVSDERLRRYLARADVCLAPIRTGSGTRLKILEYMVAGKAVVSTPKGAEGIDYVAGRDIVSVPLEEFADGISSLAADRDRLVPLGQAARALVSARYDWDNCLIPLWRGVLTSMMGQRT